MSEEILKKILEKVENIENFLLNNQTKKEEITASKIKSPNSSTYIFEDNKQPHNVLIEELLKSEFCSQEGGLSQEEILKIFKDNLRPVNPDKIQGLLRTWKNRGKIEAITEGEALRYFWNHSKITKKKKK